MKTVLIISFCLHKLFEWAIVFLKIQHTKEALPKNVRDVYSEEEYKKWRMYSADNMRLSLYQEAVSFGFEFGLLIFCIYAKLFDAMSGLSVVLQYVLVSLIIDGITTLIGIPFRYYDTFHIEEKYGMNKSTRKTFWQDVLKNFLVDFILGLLILAAIGFFFEKFGNTGLILTGAVIVAFVLLINLFSVQFMQIFNKFTPLEDGELKNSLTGLCEKYGVQVKKIVVMDASRRTTRANAFCTGITRKKTISLDDNLVNGYSTEQITAVFAHEFAHAKFKHVTKSLPFTALNLAFMVTALGVILNMPSMFSAFGFDDVNYYFVMVLYGLVSWPITILIGWASSYVSRKHEYEADAFAAREGYADELIGCLKKLNKDSLADVNPHPVIVSLYHSHPTLSQRIDAIEKVK